MELVLKCGRTVNQCILLLNDLFEMMVIVKYAYDRKQRPSGSVPSNEFIPTCPSNDSPSRSRNSRRSMEKKSVGKHPFRNQSLRSGQPFGSNCATITYAGTWSKDM
jgi:hypothetical protein